MFHFYSGPLARGRQLYCRACNFTFQARWPEAGNFTVGPATSKMCRPCWQATFYTCNLELNGLPLLMDTGTTKFYSSLYLWTISQQYHLYVSSMFLVFMLVQTVSITHFINDNSDIESNMDDSHLMNIINEYWYESSFPLSQTDISFIALTTKIFIFSVSLTIKRLSAFCGTGNTILERQRKITKFAVFRVLTYAEPGYMFWNKSAPMGICGRKTVMEYLMIWNILGTRIFICTS